MALQVTFDADGEKKAMRIDDLPLEVLEAIAKEDPDATGMWEISGVPFANTYRTYAVLDAMCDALKIDHVEHNLTPRTLDAMLEVAQDVDEMPMEDGFPKVSGETDDGSS